MPAIARDLRPSLGNTAKFPSAFPSDLAPQRLSDLQFAGKLRQEQRDARYRERRRQRLRLQSFLWDYSSLERLRSCGRRRIGGGSQVELRVREGVAHFAGLQTCGSIHSCPVCSAKVRQRRAEEADQAARWWLERYGQGSVLLLTLTIPHYAGDPLPELLELVRGAFGALVSGRRWLADKARFGLRHFIRAHDATVGPNGWHPHLHVILFGDRVLSLEELAELEERLYSRWAGAVVARGHRAPSREHGLQLEQARTRADVASYVCQVVVGSEEERDRPIALELARADLKLSRHPGHRTVWQVLDDAEQTGDCAALELWHEWERASSGMQAIRWSQGLRLLVGLDREATNEEIAAEEIGGETLHRFDEDGNEWRAVCAARNGRQELLELAVREGALAVRRRVAELLVQWRSRRRREEAA